MRTLAQIEKSIDSNLKSFVQLGQDCKDIRDGAFKDMYEAGIVDNRDYRYGTVLEKLTSYKTLAAYWKGKHGLSRQRVDQLIAASELVSKIGATNVASISESVLRPLTDLPPKQAKVVLEAAIETAPDKKPTAKYVSDIKAVFEKNAKDMEKPEVASLIKLVQSPEKLEELKQEQVKEVDRLLKLREIKKEQNKTPLSANLQKVYLREFTKYWQPIEEVRTNREQLDAAQLHIEFLLDKYPILRSQESIHIVENVS
jgi:hypothetical protein